MLDILWRRPLLLILVALPLLGAIPLAVLRSDPVAPTAVGSPAASATPTPVAIPFPDSMAAIGDSITQAVNASPNAFGGARELSWATGKSRGPLGSHYERLLARHPRIEGRSHNLSISGARMSSAPAQARRAVAHRVDYVTFLLGSNDLCAWSRHGITSSSAFERNFRRAMEILTSGLPEARIFVASIPNVARLWDLFRDDSLVVAAWDYMGTCRTMLSSKASERDRAFVRDRNLAFNETLDKACAEFVQCRFDDYAVYDHAYTRDYVSIDFFHPSLLGQRQLADITWSAGYWGNT